MEKRHKSVTQVVDKSYEKGKGFGYVVYRCPNGKHPWHSWKHANAHNKLENSQHKSAMKDEVLMLLDPLMKNGALMSLVLGAWVGFGWLIIIAFRE